jgi:hypothetical protein
MEVGDEAEVYDIPVSPFPYPGFVSQIALMSAYGLLATVEQGNHLSDEAFRPGGKFPINLCDHP